MIKQIKIKQSAPLTDFERSLMTAIIKEKGKFMTSAVKTVDGITDSEATEIMGQKVMDIVTSGYHLFSHSDDELQQILQKGSYPGMEDAGPVAYNSVIVEQELRKLVEGGFLFSDGYLFTMMRNAGLDAIDIPRKERVTQPSKTEPETITPEIISELHSHSPQKWEDDYSKCEEVFQQFVEELPTDFQRDTLIFRYRYKLSVCQIALVLHSNSRSISSTLTKLKARLIQRLELERKEREE